MLLTLVVLPTLYLLIEAAVKPTPRAIWLKDEFMGTSGNVHPSYVRKVGCVRFIRPGKPTFPATH